MDLISKLRQDRMMITYRGRPEWFVGLAGGEGGGRGLEGGHAGRPGAGADIGGGVPGV